MSVLGSNEPDRYHVNFAPFIQAAIQPDSLVGGVIMAVGAITTIYLVLRILRSSDSRPQELLIEFASQVGRIAATGVAVLTIMTIAAALKHQDGTLGHIGSVAVLTISGLIVSIAALFLIRQFLAPPWWRLNNWNPDYDHHYEGSFRDIGAWIIRDSLATISSISILDRVVVVIGLPSLFMNLAMAFGAVAVMEWLLMAMFVMYVALGVALITANRIPRVLMSRLVELRDVARRITSGDLSARASTRSLGGYEELSQLVMDINSMAKSLQNRESENHLLQHRLHTTLQHEQDLASRDGLTQLRNRRYFEQALEAEIDRCMRTDSYACVAILDLDNFKQVNDRFGHAEGDAVLQRMAHTLVNTLRPYDLAARLGGEEFGVIFPQTSPEEAQLILERIMQLLATAGAQGGQLTFSGGVACCPSHGTEVETLYKLADEAAYDAKLKGKARVKLYDPSRVSAMDSTIRQQEKARADALANTKSLVAAVDAKESADGQHSELVGQYCRAIAQALGAPEEFCNQMYMAGLLHDVGKIGMNDAVFMKSSRLSEAEYETVKDHPELGAQIVSNAGLSDLAPYVRHHHERWDGTGYPEQMRGEAIPVGARIIAVAEAFETMTTNRRYRNSVSVQEAFNELRAHAGTVYDPHLVDIVEYLLTNGLMPQGHRLHVGHNPSDQAA